LGMLSPTQLTAASRLSIIYAVFTGLSRSTPAGYPRSGKGTFMYERQLRQSGQTRRYEIRERNGAWEARALLDTQVVKQARYDDWHRVERARLRFELEVVSLEDRGWVSDS
jgi:hypothetical protein